MKILNRRQFTNLAAVLDGSSDGHLCDGTREEQELRCLQTAFDSSGEVAEVRTDG